MSEPGSRPTERVDAGKRFHSSPLESPIPVQNTTSPASPACPTTSLSENSDINYLRRIQYDGIHEHRGTDALRAPRLNYYRAEAYSSGQSYEDLSDNTAYTNR